MFHYVRIKLNITLQRSISKLFLRHIVLMIIINAEIIYITLQKSIAITIDFHKSYQCTIMREI